MGKIIIGEKAGFCFGVERALRIARESRAQNTQPVYILGSLIHNPRVVAKMEARGIKTISDLSEAEPGGILLIRSHGAGPSLLKAAEERGLQVIDATCPFVKQEQKLAQKLLAEGFQVVVVGEPQHPEVKAVVEAVDGQTVVLDPKDQAAVAATKFSARVGLVCQTTQPLENLTQVVTALLPRVKELKVYNTICHATRERQEETAKLARDVDLLLVVGGKNSANTRKLAEIGASLTPTYHIESIREIDPQWLRGKNLIGVTAGASTPQEQISEVVDWLKENSAGGIDMEENQIMNEQPAEGVKEEVQSEAAVDNGEMLLSLEIPRLEEGSIVEGIVVEVNKEEASVSVGGKSELQIPLRELTNENVASAEEVVKKGDKIKVMVLKSADEKTMLSKKRADEELAWNKLAEDYQNHRRLSGKIVQAIKGGLQVKLDGVTAFLPASQADLGYVSDLSTLEGLEAEFYLIDFDRERRRAVLSRREVLEEERRAVEEKVYNELAEGEKRTGVVTRLTPFGAFVDLDQGVEGLLHISEIAWDRLQHPSERLTEGQQIEVLVTKVDREAKRISLSLKQLSPHPWTNIEEKYKVGDLVKGKVVRLTSFGAFVNLEEGVDGLIHVSQLSDRRVEKPEEVVQVGQEVQVKVIKIEPEQRRIGLSLREAQEEKVVKESKERTVPGLEDKPLSSNLGALLAEKMEQLKGEGTE
ncbi:MAG: bifunctional 4-hydroxy-3-methylbut-2-enyl diphosphate reductase/30S ribosomal protein S1 [Firmicutes bacterium]|nr:bifunctional 4-hydroxy-3-methylbut-2-enyl diphosphate reductase/30S ribosomal protein S1 [Bacillota bacterium]